jgi:predicted HicB family RNase H-like nuclease
MMKNLLKYKGYFGSIEHSLEDMVLFGKIECISDLVNYEADSLPELKVAFEEAVEDYLETCAEIGKDPEKPMSGTFNVRVGAELHKQVYLDARNLEINLNEYVKLALKHKLDSKDQAVHMHLHIQSPDKQHIYEKATRFGAPLIKVMELPKEQNSENENEQFISKSYRATYANKFSRQGVH